MGIELLLMWVVGCFLTMILVSASTARLEYAEDRFGELFFVGIFLSAFWPIFIPAVLAAILGEKLHHAITRESE